MTCTKTIYASCTATLILAAFAATAGPLTIPNTFESGTPARAAGVNDNFTAVAEQVNDNDSRIGAIENGIAEGETRLNAIETEIADDDARFTVLEEGVAEHETRVSALESATETSPDLTVEGNLILGPSTETSGNVLKGGELFIHDRGEWNTFVGTNAGNATLTGTGNTSLGHESLFGLTSGYSNTAVGASALRRNATGINNSAVGFQSLAANVTGLGNSALGTFALSRNSSGFGNVAIGTSALFQNFDGDENIAIGAEALLTAAELSSNIAIGARALRTIYEGDNNIAIGTSAGASVERGSGNVLIAHPGNVEESNAIRIGIATHRTYVLGARNKIPATPVGLVIGMDGLLGVIQSSRRYKEDIADMSDASELLMQLRPVTFRYKKEHVGGGERPLQYGLIAEEVDEVAPQLVARGLNGEIETVLYQFLPPMLLNEYQKQQRTIEAQRKDIASLTRHLAHVREETQRLAAALARIESNDDAQLAQR